MSYRADSWVTFLNEVLLKEHKEEFEDQREKIDLLVGVINSYLERNEEPSIGYKVIYREGVLLVEEFYILSREDD